jgi:hypothetical protein
MYSVTLGDTWGWPGQGLTVVCSNRGTLSAVDRVVSSVDLTAADPPGHLKPHPQALHTPPSQE